MQLVPGSFFVDLGAFAPPDNFRWQPELGGGALLDLGYYPVSAARTLVGREPRAVNGRATLTEQGADRAFHGVMSFGGDFWSSFDAAFAPPWWQGVDVVGTSGVLSLPQPFFVPSELTALNMVVNGQVVQVENSNYYQRMVEHFADAVLNGAPLRYPATEAVAQMQALDAGVGPA